MQRLIKVDGKVRTDTTYPAGFMDVISIEKTGEHFRLVYDTKGRFTVHRISSEEAEYKLAKVKRVQLGKGGIPASLIYILYYTKLSNKSSSWLPMMHGREFVALISRWTKFW